MRLFFFNLLKGNRIGFCCILKEFGFFPSLRFTGKLQFRLLFKNPFIDINKKDRPGKNAKLSQKQMAPVVVLYEILLDSGLPKEEVLNFLRVLCNSVAVAFLSFSVPALKKDKYRSRDRDSKLRFLGKIAGRFFNADADTRLNEKDEFFMDVKRCFFARYSMELGYPELGVLFCGADRVYFEEFQGEVEFSRTVTLAEDGVECDFAFTWKE